MQHIYLGKFPIPHCLRCAIAFAVQQDAQQIPARSAGIDNADVHLIIRLSNGALGLISPLLQRGTDGIRDPRFSAVYPPQGLLVQFQLSALGVLQKGPKGRHPLRAAAGEVDLLRSQRGKDLHLIPRPGDRHIQPPPPPRPVQRAKVHRDLPGLIRPIAHGKQDHVPLIPLDILQIFDKYRLLRPVCPLFQSGIGPAGLRQKVVDQVLLADIECDNAHAVLGQLRIVAAALQLLQNCLSLRLVLPRFAPVEGALHRNQTDLGLPVVDRGEGVELVFIEAAVAEGDQTLVPTAVVPEQVGLGHIQCEAVVQNALQVLCIQVVLIHCVGSKEGGGRHLLRVAYHHPAAAPGQGAHRLAGGELGGLVEHNQVEGLPFGV